MDKRPTLKQIAEKAGVSLPVVSAVLGSKPNPNIRFSEATRERITAIAEELGYRANRTARNLINKRNDSIGILIENSFALPHAMDYWMLKSLGQQDRLLVYECIETQQEHTPQLLRDDCTDGIVVFEDLGERWNKKLKALPIPCLWVNALENGGPACLNYDEAQGIELALERFTELGCTHMVLVHNPSEHFAKSWREKAFTESCKHRSCQSSILNPEKAQDFLPAFKQLLNTSHKDSSFGLIFSLGSYALSLCSIGSELDSELLKRVKMINIGHHPMGDAISPSISYLEINTRVLSREVLKIMYDETKPRKTKRKLFPYTLVDQQSTKP